MKQRIKIEKKLIMSPSMQIFRVGADNVLGGNFADPGQDKKKL